MYSIPYTRVLVQYQRKSSLVSRVKRGLHYVGPSAACTTKPRDKPSHLVKIKINSVKLLVWSKPNTLHL